MKIVAVRVASEPVIEELGTSLEDMKKFVGGWIEAVTLDQSIEGSIVLWCNEESKLLRMHPNRYLNLLPDVICGDFFLSAVNNEGETVGLTEEEAEFWKKEVSTWETTFA